MKDLQIIQNDDGVFDVYDDTYDITIHCTNQEEQDNVLAKLNREECPDAISRSAALANAHSMGVMIDADEDDGSHYVENPKYKQFNIVEAEVIKALPPVMPKQKTGQWIKEDEDDSFWLCSECGQPQWELCDMHYCPNCGAKMREVEHEAGD